MHNSEQSTLKTRWLLCCGLIGTLFFIAAFLVEGATRAGYSAMRHPISSLAIGELGWMQIANFIITGMLILLFAIGLRRTLQQSLAGVWLPRLIGLVGIGLIGAGVFVTDPVYGYPSDVPLLLAQESTSGHLHNLFSVFVFIGLPSACFVLRRRFLAMGERGWAHYSLFTAVAMFVTFILAGVGFRQVAGFVEIAGVLQRLSIGIGWAWMALLALYFLRTKS